MNNLKKTKNMCEKQKISRQAVPTKMKNELRSKYLICIVNFENITAFSGNLIINN